MQQPQLPIEQRHFRKLDKLRRISGILPPFFVSMIRGGKMPPIRSGVVEHVIAFLYVLVTAGAGSAAEPPRLVLDTGGHSNKVSRLLFTPDGRELISVSSDKTIRIWDTISGQTLRVLRPPIGDGPEGKLYAAALAPDAQTLAVAGCTGWNGETASIYLISLTRGEIERVLSGHTNVIQDLAFSADGRRLVSGSSDKTTRVWDVGRSLRDRQSASRSDAATVLRGHTAAVHGVAFSPDGRRVATASRDNTAAIWDAATGRRLAVLEGHTAEVACIDWSWTGRWIVTGSFDHTIRVWDVGSVNGEESSVKKLRPAQTFDELANHEITSVKFVMADLRLLFTTHNPTGRCIAGLLDLSTGRTTVRFEQHTDTVEHGALGMLGQLAATCDGQGDIRLWLTGSGSALHKLFGQGSTVWSAAWSRDGNHIAWGNNNQDQAFDAHKPLERTFDLTRLEMGDVGRTAKSVQSADRTDLEVRPTSWRRAQTRLGSATLESSGRTSVDVLRGGRRAVTLQFDSDFDRKYNWVPCFTLLPGDRAAVGANFGLYLFDIRTGKLLRKLEGHTGAVWAVAPSSDGQYLLSASSDQTLRIWNVGRSGNPSRGHPLLNLFFASQEWIAWTPEGYYACSAGGERLMGWHVSNGPDRLASFQPAAQFRDKFYRPDAIKMLLRAGSIERALAFTTGERKQSVEESLPPVVVVTKPDLATVEVSQPQLSVRALARRATGSQAVTSMTLLLDGGPYQGRLGRRQVDSPSAEARGQWQVELAPGKHLIQVEAEAGGVRGLSKTIEVTYAPKVATPVKPALYVLAVGVSDYDQDRLDLNYAHRDAQVLTETLKKNAGGLYRDVVVKLITDGQATQRGIRKGLSWFRRQMTQHDVGVIFYAGHGDKDNAGTFYLLPSDVEPDDLFTTGISDATIKNLLQGIPGRKIMMLDACHAGTVGQDRGNRTRGIKPITDNLVRDLVSTEYGVIMMCSSTGRELSQESHQHRHGYFTLAVAEGLSGRPGQGSSVTQSDTNNDGLIYINELDLYISNRVKELSDGAQHAVTAKPTIVPFPLSKLR